MIAFGVFGVAMRVDGQLQGEPAWLFHHLGFGAIILLLSGLQLFAFALKREILEEVRTKHDKAA
jgi:hypothetical protein